MDSAHGGAALVSKKHRHLVAGLELADSLVWDAHKMLFVPALSAFLFYKRREHSSKRSGRKLPTCSIPRIPVPENMTGGCGHWNVRSVVLRLGLWGTWSLFGPQLFSDLVDVTFGLGREFYEILSETEDFAPLHEPQCNIVTFPLSAAGIT
ncbi:MAG: pyridoxal-dependent decarboxylase [Planctomycetales bacterium]